MDICLALGGGGIKGVAHLGVLECLEKAGFNIRAIAGTSAGGLVGAVYAAGFSPREILAILESVKPNRIYARKANDGPSLLGYTGLAEALIEVLDDTQFSDLKIPFACTAVDTHTASEVYLSEGSVMDAILATIAIPGIFPPKIIGGYELVDGGVMDPVPVRLARRLAPKLPVVAVALNPAAEDWPSIPQLNFTPPSGLPVPAPLVEGLARMRIGQAFRIFLQSNDISMRAMTEMRLEIDQPDVIIRPDVHDYAIIDVAIPVELVERGSRAADKALPEIKKTLAWPNTIVRQMRQVIRSGQKEPGRISQSENGGQVVRGNAP